MVLFIPGFMQRGDAWRPVAELLPERYPSRLLDHAEHSFEGRMREIAEAGADVLVGYSLGGRLALRAALRSPESFTAVVLVGSTAGFEEGPLRVGRAEADEKLASWMEAMPIEDIVSLWERQPLFADQADALVEQQRPGRLSHDPRSLALLLRTAGQGALEPVWHELRALELPLLAIAGARDDGYSAAAKRIAATAPQGRAVIVEDAGHAAHLQQPQRVADLITEFLERLH
ncbi:MAG: 2-succinyl-6-hydroxy-2,4-cyclohexadiene-carboxylate synthase [Thermoleophilaceae bacterium]|jgi:2-succinyl-6-hydroxy-2,4-cyclohexadiene-1-carboxylate synthase|nr:2-succinyl-6-hydroxy-2,4-cyclohexadiene-carboxylate synthase [Thermoleophilaceae bacterium]